MDQDRADPGKAGLLGRSPSLSIHHCSPSNEDDVDQYFASPPLDEPSPLHEALRRAEEARDDALTQATEVQAMLREESGWAVATTQRLASGQAQSEISHISCLRRLSVLRTQQD